MLSQKSQSHKAMHDALLEYSLDTTSDKIEKCLQPGCAVQGRAGWGREGRGGGGGGGGRELTVLPTSPS